MMADGSFDTLGRIDAVHMAATGQDAAPDAVERALIAVKNDEPMAVERGQQLFHKKLKKIVTVYAWSGAVRWDDDRDKYVPCSKDHPDVNFESVMFEFADGVKAAGFYPDFLVQPYKPEDRKYLPKPKVEILSYDDMIALEDPEWLIDGVISKETSALMFGKSNSFKSFLAIDCACSVATGTAWHGAKVKGPSQVLYAATEGSRGVGKQRIPGWMETHDIPPALRRNVHMMRDEISLDNPNWVDHFLSTAAIIKAHATLSNGGVVFDETDPAEAFSLVVIDIFGASMMGPETSDETARAWVRSINRIMREMRCSVLTVAHTGWADETRARMHTHFWGSFDTRMKAEGDKDSLTTVLKIDRHKDADSTGQWGFRMDSVTLPNGQTTLVPRLCDEVETTQKRRVSGKPAVAMQALSEALAEHGRTIAGPSYPACQVVATDQWRAMCDRHGLTESDNPETLRKAFNRAKDALIEKGLVRQFDSNVWRTEPNG